MHGRRGETASMESSPDASPKPLRVSVVGVDADDTLWRTSHLYDDAIKEFVETMAPWDPGISATRLVNDHFQAAARYGFGALALLRTMVEIAVRIGPDVAGPACEKALRLVTKIHEDAAHPFVGADQALAKLREKGLRLVLITKGAAAEQTAKLERSGLSERFDTVVVLAHKDVAAYRQLFKDLGVEPDRFVMFGDSVANDIEPVLEAGGQAVLLGAAGDDRPAGVPVVPYLWRLPDLLDAYSPYDDYPEALGALLKMLATGNDIDGELGLGSRLVELQKKGLSQDDMRVHVERLRAQNEVTTRDEQIEDRCMLALDLITGYHRDPLKWEPEATQAADR